MDMFSSFRPEFLLYHYQAGELLSSPFMPMKGLHILVEGQLSLYDMPSEDSFTMIQSPYYSARVLGEIELINPDFIPFFVEAKTDVYALVLPFEEYRPLLLKDCDFMLYVCRSISRKLDNAISRSHRRPLREELLKYFARTDRTIPIRDITHFSYMFGRSPRQMIRTLKVLCEEGYLDPGTKGSYYITDKIAELYGKPE